MVTLPGLEKTGFTSPPCSTYLDPILIGINPMIRDTPPSNTIDAIFAMSEYSVILTLDLKC